jgi:predicted GIY-YIG superfamily endonuclease
MATSKRDGANHTAKRLPVKLVYAEKFEHVADALRLLQERDQLREMRLQELRSEIQKGIDSGSATPLDIG